MSVSSTRKASPNTARRPGSDPDGPIAIVGGGITGLFCAYVLATTGHDVELFESSDQFGGRIRSFLLNRDLMNDCATNERARKPRPIKDGAVITELEVDDGVYKNLEFCAEFGPMRIELDVQVLLKFLLKQLKIGEDPVKGANVTALDAAHLQEFPQFSSPTSEEDPLYPLRPDEEGKNPLELMSLALCRAVAHIRIDETHLTAAEKTNYNGKAGAKPNGYKQKREALINSLRDAVALQEPIGPAFQKWAQTLREDDYWLITRHGYITIGEPDHSTDVPLHAMGFWNLMSIYLSHNALTKVRDLGTFYHLLPENPNAAHWLTWQLRQLSISNALQGINAGMQTITEKLLDAMKYKPNQDPRTGGECTVGNKTFPMLLKAHVDRVEKEPDGLHVVLESGRHYPLTKPRTKRTGYRRVILALPKAPAYELVMASKDLKSLHNSERKPGTGTLTLPYMLDASFGFPMVKAFFVVRDRWWEEDKRANWFATRIPTREIHYWKSRDPKSRRGMVMLYTDRPASSFWANYVPAGRQYDVEELCVRTGKTDKDREMIRARLKQRLVQYINENRVPDITEQDIIWCAVMDWGRPPYGAGNHAWRPERRFWESMADLADLTFDDGSGLHVHVCGEAFTDYTGFIEGSLRSATYILTKILKRGRRDTTEKLLRSILGVLGVENTLLNQAFSGKTPSGKKTRPREHDYVEDLKTWIDNLNNC